MKEDLQDFQNLGGLCGCVGRVRRTLLNEENLIEEIDLLNKNCLPVMCDALFLFFARSNLLLQGGCFVGESTLLATTFIHKIYFAARTSTSSARTATRRR